MFLMLMGNSGCGIQPFCANRCGAMRAKCGQKAMEALSTQDKDATAAWRNPKGDVLPQSTLPCEVVIAAAAPRFWPHTPMIWHHPRHVTHARSTLP